MNPLLVGRGDRGAGCGAMLLGVCVCVQGPSVESICSLTPRWSLAYSASTDFSIIMGCADFPSIAELLNAVHLTTGFCNTCNIF